ncbi:MAG: transglutaminase-like domain-containing protein [Oscillospiraceae bacterium]|nr:transglutaminase-like domain-containing protein [Oscillospiraceae bacterium]
MEKRKSFLTAAIIFALVLTLFPACSVTEWNIPDIGADDVPLASGAPETVFAAAEASGLKVEANQKIILDYSNTAEGYVMLKYLGRNQKVKTLITGPNGVTYTYNQSPAGIWDVYSLTEGNGNYKVSVFENISGVSYAAIFSFYISVSLKDEFAPFLLSNKYVSYTSSSKAVKKSSELCVGKTSVIEKIKAVYEYVTGNFTYDYTLAETVQSGYIPNLDADMDKKSGICFDYAAVMTAMLRCQGIPTKMVFGYTGSVYHAWISVYSAETGWMNAVIYFNGKEWKLMDPTFASTGKSSAEIMKYIGNGKNYTVKYLY